MNQGIKNHLSSENSPYLLQHLFNPVDWYPWGQDAFNKAKKENRLIFLSIGYSTCHWCHVMEMESFSQSDVGKFMNQRFVSIKVDREERPDIDSVFIEFSNRTTGSAGWPLNVILTPDGLPVFSFTYIPRTSRYGSMGIIELLESIDQLWIDNPDEIVKKALDFKGDAKDKKPLKMIQSDTSIQPDMALSQLSKSFDKTYGGFGHSMKFPSPHILSFLGTFFENNNKSETLKMMELTLGAMRMGGIYDHISSGLHRYATDPGWKIPHFEKMLYDQAGLIGALAKGFSITGKNVYRETLRDLLGFIRDNFKDPKGGYFTAIDADSDGVEGKYYVWKYSELANALGSESSNFLNIMNIMEEGNFLDSVKGISNGENILYMNNENKNVEQFLHDFDKILTSELRKNLSDLKMLREKRNPPSIDTKICGDLNGYLLYQLSSAYSMTQDESIYDDSSDLFEYLKNNLVSDGKVIHIKYNDGKYVPGFFSDYAFIALGMFQYGMITGQQLPIEEAEKIMDTARIILKKEIEDYRRTGSSSFVGTFESQEDSSMPSQFSAFERAEFLENLTGNFADPLPLTTPEVEDNVKKYPSFFAFKMETILMRKNSFVLKGNFQGKNTVEKMRKMFSDSDVKIEYYLQDNEHTAGVFSLCNSSACVLDRKNIDEVLGFIAEMNIREE